MRIYVASSWRNEIQPEIVAALRELGHDVYDFKNPPSGTGFSWSEVDPSWKITDGEKGFVGADKYKSMLAHERSERGYVSDINALRECDAVVYVLPCGRSASWEFGYAMGAGKPGYVVWFGAHEPELMFREATVIGSMEELRQTFSEVCPSCNGMSPTVEQIDEQLKFGDHYGACWNVCGTCSNTHAVAVKAAISKMVNNLEVDAIASADGSAVARDEDMNALARLGVAGDFRVCPKCNYGSGDDWSQCQGKCPMPMSPHFDQQTANLVRSESNDASSK